MHPTLPPLHLHKLMRFARITRIHKGDQDGAQLLEVHRLRHVAVEARLHALLIHIAQHIRGQRDDGQVWVLALLLPLADLLARLIAVLVGHVEVAEDDGVMAIGLREDFLRALHTVEGGLDFDVDFGQELEDDLDIVSRFEIYIGSGLLLTI